MIRLIISHKYRFIFIHCRKVAGSAIKTTLWPHLGEHDLMIGSLNEVMALGHSPNRRARRALWHPSAWNPARKAWMEHVRHGNSAKYRSLLNTAVKAAYKRRLFHNPVHSPAERVRRAFPHEWEHYYKFCFVRNPYDQAVSEYAYQMKNAGRQASFHYFLKAMNGDIDDPAIVPGGLKRNWSLYALNGEPVVDFIGRYEALEADFTDVCQRLGIPVDQPLRQEKVGQQRRRKALSEWYDEETVELVRSIYGREIEYFGYSSPV